MIRRDFIKTTGAATGIFGVTGLIAKGMVDSSVKRPICVFSKCLQFLDFDEMGELLAKLGFDGVDLSVRPGGHVEPSDVKAKLPLAVKTMKKKRFICTDDGNIHHRSFCKWGDGFTPNCGGQWDQILSDRILPV